jgi:NAD(P)-dependent dehydrogenase (short-subunit alcohol dehydrogenase family)
MELKPLDRQVIVVFGASSGIGRVTARVALERGACVVAAARGEGALATLAGDVPSARGRLEAVTADAADHAAVVAVAERAVARFGRIDTWAHVAGVGEFARFEDTTPEEFRRIVDVDLLGPVYGAMAALPHLRRQGGAYIVVSSELARRGLPLMAAYSAAKHGVTGFVEALRVELRHEGAPVSVTEILPAAIGTPFFEHARTRLGVRPSGPPPVYGPEKVAHAILRAAEQPRRDTIVGGAAKVQLFLQKLSPRVMDAFGRVAMRFERSSEPKSPRDSDALDAPVRGDDRERGVVTTTHR